jgi:hypothetical protein
MASRPSDYVGPPDGLLAPRLVETSDKLRGLAQHERRYVALSHCWGSREIITTKVANIEERKRGIRLEDLSQTFRDAVIATRNLNMRFLWIGNLCIMQDTKEDWEKQSIQMCRIYQRAVFTIMAAHASGGDEGCFVERDGLAQLPSRLQFKIRNMEDTITSACFLSLSRMSAELSFSRPLYSRAWVLQASHQPSTTYILWRASLLGMPIGTRFGTLSQRRLGSIWLKRLLTRHCHYRRSLQ